MSLHRSVAASDSPPSVEQVRKQAKRRLIGVAVLVLAAVVVFPLLFDTQPRPVPVDMPIDIPSRKVSKPLQVDSPAVPVPDASTAPASVPASPQPLTTAAIPPTVPSAPSGSPVEAEEVILESTPARKPSSEKPVPMVKTPPAPVAAATATAAHPAPPAVDRKGEAAARAQALLEGRTPPPVSTAGSGDGEKTVPRFIVQVGAYADANAAQSARLKLERAGLKTYTHVAQTSEGKRTRVRLGPFTTRAEADKAAAKAKSVGLPAAILTL